GNPPIILRKSIPVFHLDPLDPGVIKILGFPGILLFFLDPIDEIATVAHKISTVDEPPVPKILKTSFVGHGFLRLQLFVPDVGRADVIQVRVRGNPVRLSGVGVYIPPGIDLVSQIDPRIKKGTKLREIIYAYPGGGGKFPRLQSVFQKCRHFLPGVIAEVVALYTDGPKFQTQSSQSSPGCPSGIYLCTQGIGNMKIAIHLWLFTDEQVLVLVPPPVNGRLDVPSITDFRKSHLGIAGLDFFVLVDISGTRIKTVRSKFTIRVPRQDGPFPLIRVPFVLVE